MATGLADAIRAPRGRPGVQGIASDLNDILLRGESWKTQLGDALLDALLSRAIAGASTLKLEVHDHQRRLLNHPLLQAKYDLEVDGLGFRYKGFEQSGRGAPLTLIHEALAVALLRELHGPHKAYRDKLTRAQFSKRRVREVENPLIPFICPELDVVQPIETEKQSREADQSAKEKRGKGIGKADHLTVKGDAATPEQIELGERALRIAEGLKADDRVMAVLMVALIVESRLGADSANVLQGTEGKAQGVEHDVTGFLTGHGWTGTGAIPYEKANPGKKIYQIAQAVQASGAGLASDGAANYGPWVDEAWSWVETFGGGAGSISTTETLRYALEERKKEDNWKCITRLASEVNWRCFESAGAVYYIDELDLLRSSRRMIVSDSTPGVEDTAPKYDEGKPVTEFRVSVRARSWAAPPGSVAEVKRHGPCNGLYIVEKIDSRLRKANSICDVTLKRPTKPLPEPAPETKTRSVGFGATSGTGSSPRTPAGAPPQLDAMLARMEELSGTPYKWGGGHAGFEQDPAVLDCSGAISDVLHAGGYLDIPTSSGPMASMFQAGRGEWFALYANAEHVFCEVRTADGWVEWEEGGVLGSKAGFLAAGSHPKGGFTARHPKGL